MHDVKLLVFLYLAYPQGKRYNGPLNNNNKKKGNRKSFKEKDTRGKTPGFPKKSLSSIQPTQKSAANKNGQKAQTQSINGSSTQALEGESCMSIWFHLLTVIYFYSLIEETFLIVFFFLTTIIFFFFLKEGMNPNSAQWISYARDCMRRLKNPEGRSVVWSRVHIFLF